jgi:hypothetical protein
MGPAAMKYRIAGWASAGSFVLATGRRDLLALAFAVDEHSRSSEYLHRGQTV